MTKKVNKYTAPTSYNIFAEKVGAMFAIRYDP